MRPGVEISALLAVVTQPWRLTDSNFKSFQTVFKQACTTAAATNGATKAASDALVWKFLLAGCDATIT
jgi:hypothetical protein